MNMVRAGLFIAGIALTLAYSTPVRAEEVGCVTTAWKMLGAFYPPVNVLLESVRR
jgi:hypothetical protein